MKLEVHMSSVWCSGNAAAEASANPAPLIVFQWLMQLSHTPEPQDPRCFFKSSCKTFLPGPFLVYLYTVLEELKQECCALP